MPACPTKIKTKVPIAHLPSQPTYKEASDKISAPPPPHRPPLSPTTPNNSPNSSRTKRNRKRKNILWYNPPYNKALKTKFGKEFLKLLDKNFPKNHPLSRIMNRKKVKISYSNSPNMQSILAAHNRKILAKNNIDQPDPNACNCRNHPCPVKDEKCATKSVIYQAEVENVNYIGMTSNTLKQRITCHRQTFRDEDKRNATTLAAYIWDNKLNKNPENQTTEPNVTWTILKTCQTYEPGNKACDLCISEKLFLIKEQNNTRNINKRNDIANKCCHKRSYYFSAIK